eukprot:7334619-Prymnesium_polylepis.1
MWVAGGLRGRLVRAVRAVNTVREQPNTDGCARGVGHAARSGIGSMRSRSRQGVGGRICTVVPA